MKHFALLLLLLVFLLSCSSKTKVETLNGVEYAVTPIDSSANYLIETDSFTGVVFSNHEKLTHDVFTFRMLFRPRKEENITPFTPSLEEVISAEKILKRCAENETEGADSLDIGVIEELPFYKRQYFGGINEKGQKLIWINSFPANDEDFTITKNWQTDIVEVNDGGNYFFNVVTNIDTGECYRFFVNSMASNKNSIRQPSAALTLAMLRASAAQIR
jgi:hypothetical protein